MKFFIAVLVLFCVFYGPDLSATPVFVYNHGYVMGELTGVDLIGPTQKVVSGVVSVGNNSFGGEIGGPDELGGDYVLENPWPFCGGMAYYGQLAAHIGEFVVIEYKTPKSSALLQCRSNNEIVGIYPVSREGPGSSASESTKINVTGKQYGVSVRQLVSRRPGR